MIFRGNFRLKINQVGVNMGKYLNYFISIVMTLFSIAALVAIMGCGPRYPYQQVPIIQTKPVQLTAPQMQYTPVQTPQLSAPTFTNYNQRSVTAYWTGNVNYVTTITYQSGVNCEYNYAGQSFWRTFTRSNCPSQIEVQ